MSDQENYWIMQLLQKAYYTIDDLYEHGVEVDWEWEVQSLLKDIEESGVLEMSFVEMDDD